MTAVTITATPRPSSLATTLSITVAGAVAGETMTVVRRVGNQAAQTVMGASAIDAASRALVDPEVPLNRATTWTVTTSSGATATTAALTVAAELATLADPVRGLVAQLAVIDRDDWARTQRIDLVQVEGAEVPAVVWDVPLARQMPVTLLTITPDTDTVLGLLLATGNPLLLRCACSYHSDVWIQSIDAKTSSSRLVARGASQLRRWDLGQCLIYPTNPRAAIAARGNTLGAIYDAVAPKTLGAIADRWATLGVIADADLGGGS